MTDRLGIRKDISETVNHVLDMMEAKELVDRAISMYENEIGEMTSTGAVAGYLTPRAFGGGSKEGKTLMVKRSVGSTGWLHTDEGLDDVEDGGDRMHRADEGYGPTNLNALKADQERTGRRKIADEVSNVRKALRSINRGLKTIKKYKSEVGYSGESFWKRTQSDIYKMDELLLRISDSLREMRT